MTREEQKTGEFIAGMRDLSEKGRDYIKNLTRSLFLVENPAIIPGVRDIDDSDGQGKPKPGVRTG
jgi:hypothetical protein